MPPILFTPDPEKVTPTRAAAVLRRLGVEWAIDPLKLRLPIPRIVPLLPTGGTEWWVGDDVVVAYQGSEADFPHKGNWAADDASGVPAHSPSVAAAILVHAWNNPKLRPLFDLPAWALDLVALTDRSAPTDDSAGTAGFIRYTLGLGGPDNPKLPVSRELIRLSRRDGRPLRPVVVDDARDRLHGRVRGLTRADLAFHRARRALCVLPFEVGDLADELAAEAFEQLMLADELYYQGLPLRPDPTPFEPVLEALDGDEGIELRWADEVLDTYAAGPGYVITTENRLRPLAAATLAASPELLQSDLPTVPFADADAFLERFVRHSGVALALDSDHLPRSRMPDALLGHVRLAEADDALVVDLAFGYMLGEHIEEIEPDERASHRTVGNGLLRRDLSGERRLAGLLESHLGRPSPARLRGDAALDFLAMGPSALGVEFRFYGRENLRRHRVVGTFSPRLHAGSGLDWLDIGVQFEVNGQRIDGSAVLQSWLDGARYHRLPDGTLARLPAQWLEDHGRTAAELEELRAQGDGRLSAFAAPLIDSLLEAADASDIEAAAIARWREMLERLGNLERVPEYPVPPELKADLRSYQVDGYRWLIFLRDLGLGACLADDMGLGKTLQAITALLETHRPNGVPEPGESSLVVAPTSVVHNWLGELGKFAPTLKVVVHHGPDRDVALLEQADIVITSYALMRIEVETFSRPWRMVILDEAQQIKNPTSRVARAARELNARHKIALTGTPLENHLLELWSIFEFLMPGFFGTRASFQRRYAQPIERDRDPAALTGLRRRLRPFVLRRHKSEVAKELPPRQEQVLYCDLGPAQRQLYERVKATYREAVLGKVRRDGVRAATLSVLEALMRLRQACCDPGLLPYPEAAECKESAKLDLLLETLHEAIEAGHRTLVFSQWPSLLRRVRRSTDQRGWRALFLDGGTTKRHELVDVWNDPEGPPLFYISLKAGGSGLNLTGADHVIHLDPWWNPAVEAQATDRAHRIGQTKPVVAYKLVARDTVEEKILELQARKKALFEAALEQDRTVVEQLTRADLEAVFAGDEVTPLRQGTRPPSAPPPPMEPILEAPVGDELANVPTILARLLRRGERLTNGVVRDQMGWSSDEARRWLREQVAAGTLEQRGRKRGTHYVLDRS
jgi:hypothetical protein